MNAKTIPIFVKMVANASIHRVTIIVAVLMVSVAKTVNMTLMSVTLIPVSMASV